MSGNQSTKKTETDQAEAAPHPKLVPADPCAIVIFGATGDLTNRLVMPAIYNLARTKVLPQDFSLIGVARSEDDVDGWRKQLHDMLKGFVGNPSSEFNVDHIDEGIWKRLTDRMLYIRGDLTDPDVYAKVGEALKQAEKNHGTKGNAIFYLAIADKFFGTVVEQLGKAKLTDQQADQAA